MRSNAVEPLNEKNENLQEIVQRCHNNLGHPSQERFLHLLKSAGASEKAIQLAKGLKCSVCLSKKPPGTHPVVKTKRVCGFNQRVCMDVFEVGIFDQKKLKMLNMICEGTGLQVCVPLWKGAKSSEVRRVYRKFWKRWAGSPVQVLVDGGMEFGGEVQDGFDRDNTLVTVTAADSPWQNGLAERHGGIWKDIFQKSFEECQPRNKHEINELCDKVCESKNCMIRKHGFSPMQHVFGCELRIPYSLIDEGNSLTFKHNLLMGVESHTRAQEIRQSARRAMIVMDDQENVRKAIHRQSRPDKKPFEVGDYIYYWRRSNDKRGLWKGPARVIGFFESKSRIWVAHGNKVLRCSPSQLKHLTDEQVEAVTAVMTNMLPLAPEGKRGAQVFTDISTEGSPDHDDMDMDDEEHEHRAKRARYHRDEPPDVEYSPGTPIPDDGDSLNNEFQSEPTGQTTLGSGNLDLDDMNDGEEPASTEEALPETEHHGGETIGTNNWTPDGSDDEPNSRNLRSEPYDTGARAVTSTSASSASSYGPMRHDLTQALRRSVDILDHGNTRVSRSQMATSPETHDTFLAQTMSNHEVHLKDLTPKELTQLDAGKLKEWGKLLKTGSIKVHTGKDADAIRSEHPPERFLESRFVKTRRDDPENPGETELKCRWCIKGFLDPDLFDLQRQSPTLSMEGLAVCLQIIASCKWRLVIADVEGAFLQGEPLARAQGRLFVKIPKEGIPNCDPNDVVEVLKCVYGLVDAPRAWWISFSNTLKTLGMKQSELDPCVFYWHHEGVLEGCISLHVDDMVIGGTDRFHQMVLGPLKQRYPFKHWKIGGGMFLGKQLKQNEDFSIFCDQKEYAEKVQTIKLTKDRRKQKHELITESERRKLRGVVGAANWMMGNTRPDIAVCNAFLQQRIQCATVSDLIEANKLVAKIRDFSHVRIWIQSIPIHEGVLLVSSDASWANNQDLTSQAGYMVLFAHRSVTENKVAAISPLRWKSYKQERHTQSTLGAELMGISRAIAEANWMRSLFAEALHDNYELCRDQEFREQMMMVVTCDNKPIYDHTCGDVVVVKDKRMAIEMLIVRRDIRKNNIVLRWVATKQMLVDCLTKTNAAADFMLRCLKEGRYCVCLMTPDAISS